MDDQHKNPFLGIRIGCFLDDTKEGMKFLPPVIKDNVSKFKDEIVEKKTITGTSSYCYTDEMNQGTLSFSLAGKFAKSNIGFSAGGYKGSASSQDEKTIKLRYSGKITAGIQYIDFTDLKISQFINSLNTDAQNRVRKALDSFAAIQVKLRELGGTSLKDAYLHKSQPQYHDLFKSGGLVPTWLDDCRDFFKNYFHSFVAKIYWGAYGGVALDITEKHKDHTANIGAQGTFQYATIITSLAISSSYDGSETRQKADAHCTATSYCYGQAIQSDINEWARNFMGKAYNTISDIAPLEKIPHLSNEVTPPEVPDFKAPPPRHEDEENLDDIENADNLEGAAEIAAYNDLINDEDDSSLRTETFQEFLAHYKKSADDSGIKYVVNKVKNNNIVVQTGARIINETDDSPGLITVANPVKDNSDLGTKYVPLNVGLLRWSDVFPWLATGFNNNVSPTSKQGKKLDSTLQLRTFVQDLGTLSKLYYSLASAPWTGKLTDGTKSVTVGDTYANGLSQLFQNLTTMPISQAISSVYSQFGETEQKIYDTWNNNSLLRNIELGLAMKVDANNQFVTSMKLDNHSPKVIVLDERISFSLSTQNYVVLAPAYKFYPYIDSDQSIRLFSTIYSSVPTIKGYNPLTICDCKNWELGPNSPSPLVLSVTTDRDSGKEYFKARGCSLYPIPMSAAKGISDWKGSSFNTALSSFSKLNKQLELLLQEFSSLPQWSLSSEAWDSTTTINKDTGYSISMLDKQYQYIGIIPKTDEHTHE